MNEIILKTVNRGIENGSIQKDYMQLLESRMLKQRVLGRRYDLDYDGKFLSGACDEDADIDGNLPDGTNLTDIVLHYAREEAGELYIKVPDEAVCLTVEFFKALMDLTNRYKKIHIEGGKNLVTHEKAYTFNEGEVDIDIPCVPLKLKLFEDEFQNNAGVLKIRDEHMTEYNALHTALGLLTRSSMRVECNTELLTDRLKTYIEGTASKIEELCSNSDTCSIKDGSICEEGCPVKYDDSIKERLKEQFNGCTDAEIISIYTDSSLKAYGAFTDIDYSEYYLDELAKGITSGAGGIARTFSEEQLKTLRKAVSKYRRAVKIILHSSTCMLFDIDIDYYGFIFRRTIKCSVWHGEFNRKARVFIGYNYIIPKEGERQQSEEHMFSGHLQDIRLLGEQLRTGELSREASNVFALYDKIIPLQSKETIENGQFSPQRYIDLGYIQKGYTENLKRYLLRSGMIGCAVVDSEGKTYGITKDILLKNYSVINEDNTVTVTIPDIVTVLNNDFWSSVLEIISDGAVVILKGGRNVIDVKNAAGRFRHEKLKEEIESIAGKVRIQYEVYKLDGIVIEIKDEGMLKRKGALVLASSFCYNHAVELEYTGTQELFYKNLIGQVNECIDRRIKDWEECEALTIADDANSISNKAGNTEALERAENCLAAVGIKTNREETKIYYKIKASISCLKSDAYMDSLVLFNIERLIGMVVGAENAKEVQAAAEMYDRVGTKMLSLAGTLTAEIHAEHKQKYMDVCSKSISCKRKIFIDVLTLQLDGCKKERIFLRLHYKWRNTDSYLFFMEALSLETAVNNLKDDRVGKELGALVYNVVADRKNG